MTGLTKGDVMLVVNRYIGVFGGYLGDFSYRTHADFYPEFCSLDIDSTPIQGTTRECFIHVLLHASPGDQAKILQGVLDRFPLDGPQRPTTRTAETRHTIETLIRSLSDGPHIASPTVASQSRIVERALRDAETLISQQGATRAVDRVHTSLHAYLATVCQTVGIPVGTDDSLTVLFKAVRQQHPAFAATGPRADDIATVLRSFASVLDALNPLRNKASMAHPQPALLEPPEAMVVVHAGRTVLHYLEARLGAVGKELGGEG